MIGKILYSQTVRVTTPFSARALEQGVSAKRTYGPQYPLQDIKGSERKGRKKCDLISKKSIVNQVPSTSAILTPQENSTASLLTERKRFFNF
jgi:hypothetical protein